MSLTSNEQFQGPTVRDAKKRVFPDCIQRKTFAIGDGKKGHQGTLLAGTPLGTNAANEFVIWNGVENDFTVSGSGSPTGNVKLIFNGVATANIALPASAATVQAALEALAAIDPGDVVVTGGPLPTSMSVKFLGQWTFIQVTLTTDNTGISGGVVNASSAPAGVGPEAQFTGIVWPNHVTLDPTLNVLGDVMLAGRIHRGDIIDSNATSATTFNTHAVSKARAKQIILEGLPGFR